MLDFLFGISSAVAEEATAGATNVPGNMSMASCFSGEGLVSTLVTLVPLLLMIVVFYFLLIRPQKKKDKQVKDMLAALKPGDRVTTIGGIYGTITAIREDLITLAVGQTKTEMVFARWAIRNVEEVSIENDVGTELT